MNNKDNTIDDNASEASLESQDNNETICDGSEEGDAIQYPIDKDNEKSALASVIYKDPKYSAMTTFLGYDTSIGHYNSWIKRIDEENPGQLIDIIIDPKDHLSVHNFNNLVTFISPVWEDKKLSMTDISDISITYNDNIIISLSGVMCYNILTLNKKLFTWVCNVMETSNVIAIPIQYLLMENDTLNLSALTHPLHITIKSEEHIRAMVEMECYTVSKFENLNFINSAKVYRRFHYDS